ncbi:hypothetical protein [Xenorhabdus bovienii]|uniref:hypothetical protein n=1 Tax=Xenorhabdus bovienii TaxID=40576 RepID=UPI0023B34D89|nr:hypothetical protein [Xenorhabdus bovienii]MDE9454612.1 hypothetical protein [Xenorhabdus bovienii]MDE9494398.1 hypothetical protein [Xenorhabdus bovienii]MDE9502837.1 hypothetical protein [Xenorhabdus bovienii]MDE9526452.1 hypothetical protein [Xenorhabdus bovienii]MDE9568757.1 hypothetical protein [Xenorhabdus bovienii]
MTLPVNVVAFVETDFTKMVRDRLDDRGQSFELAEWAFRCLQTGENKEEMRQMVGVLVNEVFFQRKIITDMENIVRK